MQAPAGAELPDPLGGSDGSLDINHRHQPWSSLRVTRGLGLIATTGPRRVDRNSLRANEFRKEFGFVSHNFFSSHMSL